jgi:hypothetical protein
MGLVRTIFSCPTFASLTTQERSTNNQRIERLWVDVGSQFVRRWRVFFARLEGLHGLQVDCAEHLWLLHELFLDEINADCALFQNDWNHHGVSGPKTNNQTPSVSGGCYMSSTQVSNKFLSGYETS